RVGLVEDARRVLEPVARARDVADATAHLGIADERVGLDARDGGALRGLDRALGGQHGLVERPLGLERARELDERLALGSPVAGRHGALVGRFEIFEGLIDLSGLERRPRSAEERARVLALARRTGLHRRSPWVARIAGRPGWRHAPYHHHHPRFACPGTRV